MALCVYLYIYKLEAEEDYNRRSIAEDIILKVILDNPNLHFLHLNHQLKKIIGQFPIFCEI